MPRFTIMLPALCALLLSACQIGSQKERPEQGDRFRVRGIGEAQVEADLTEFLRRFEGQVSWASYRIQRASSDREIQRKAILWRALFVPTAQSAAFQPTASGGLIDLWALVLQMDAYFREGGGRSVFGEHQSIALDTCADLRATVELIEPDLPHGDTAFLKGRIEEWAKRNPLGDDGYARPSTAAVIANLLGEQERSLGQTVRGINERIEDLTNRVTIYADSLPRQARWQGELIAEEIFARAEIEGAFRDMAVAADSLERLAELQDFIGVEFGRLEQVAESERTIILRDVERQRGEILAAVTREREAVLADVDRQRIATLEALEKEKASVLETGDAMVKEVLASVRETREEFVRVVDDEHRRVFADAEKLATRTIDQSLRDARGLVDHVALRGVQGGAVLIALAFVAAVLYRRLTR